MDYSQDDHYASILYVAIDNAVLPYQNFSIPTC
jgi:hypothetical protein